MKSLKSRMSFATVVLLLASALVLATLLMGAFKKTLLASEQNRMEAVVYTVLSTIDVIAENEILLDETLLADGAQGADILIANGHGEVLWPDGSKPKEPLLEVGQWRFEVDKRHHPYYFTLGFGFSWRLEDRQQELEYSIFVKDKGASFTSQMASFQRKLFFWLGVGCAVLIFLQMLMLHWVFAPLQSISEEVQDIEEGHKHKFENKYPLEVTPLTKNINSLLRHERAQQTRFRQALDNLAHALKTPLAALRAMVSDFHNVEDFSQLSKLQLSRMQSIIDYQLKKASTVGHSAFTRAVNLKKTIDAIVFSLQKVYRQKNIEFLVLVDAGVTVKVDEGDLYEVLGNVIENAAKYGVSKVLISWRNGLCTVEDDGKGLSEKDVEAVIQRGVRLDERVEGFGIGLAVAYEIVSAYGGVIEFGRSDWGGAKVNIGF